ncbi:isoflavone reductase family protein [Ophiostoma piceae UAMH 11346]|uniref:Isoflavone reductase family protein n=1 Tax=Ophiostoma piceae (strain UAMH 11346) TaxID=1262450 RepID=S3C8X8_OPHP1|nr:isoflavone reductase family protein [Ophiostoma piceae UAMH 11346]
MSFTPARLLLFGGTGAIGSYITEAILKRSASFSHVALFTSPATVAAKQALLAKWKTQGLSEVVVGDITSAADITKAYASVKPDTVVSALGRGALHLQRQLVAIADAPDNSVQWFFPSEYGTDIEHNAKSPNEKPHQHKLALRKFIHESVKNLKITYLVTGPYFDMWVDVRGDPRGGGYDVPAKKAYLVAPDAKVGFCTMADVGKFLVAALAHPEASFGKALKVQSFIVTPREVLAEYEKQTGGTWQVQTTTLAELEALEAKAWADGFPGATGYTLRRIWAEGGTLYDKNDNEAIGVSEADLDSLADAVKREIARVSQ